METWEELREGCPWLCLKDRTIVGDFDYCKWVGGECDKDKPCAPYYFAKALSEKGDDDELVG